MIEISYQLTGRFIEHSWFWTRFHSVVNQAVDATMPDIFIQSKTLNLRSQVTVSLRPLALLDNSAVHVNNVNTSVRTSVKICGAEIHVSGSDKLFLMICILKSGLPFFVYHFCPAYNACYRLVNQIIPN